MRVWIIEFQGGGGKWLPSIDYEFTFLTKKEAAKFISSRGVKGLIYRVSQYERIEKRH